MLTLSETLEQATTDFAPECRDSVWYGFGRRVPAVGAAENRVCRRSRDVRWSACQVAGVHSTQRFTQMFHP
jgi:hypothetical protein